MFIQIIYNWLMSCLNTLHQVNPVRLHNSQELNKILLTTQLSVELLFVQ
jgi:hypothetical protein